MEFTTTDIAGTDGFTATIDFTYEDAGGNQVVGMTLRHTDHTVGYPEAHETVEKIIAANDESNEVEAIEKAYLGRRGVGITADGQGMGHPAEFHAEYRIVVA